MEERKKLSFYVNFGIKYNFNETCQEFVKFLKKKGKNILNRVGANSKYF